ANAGVALSRALDRELALVRSDDLLFLGIRHDHEAVAILDRSRDLRLARRLLGDTRRCSTDVECAERELSSRLADRLRGDDTNGFTLVDHSHGREVAAVAHLA